MPDEKTYTPSLELVYRPDTYTETERQEGASWPLGSGHYDLYANVDGARIHLNTFKAGQVDKLLAQAKEQKQNEQQQQTEQTPAPPASAPSEGQQQQPQ